MRWRDWGVTALAWIAVLGLAGMALAGSETTDEPAVSLVQAQDEDEGPSAQGGDGEGHAVENHGRCVSAWVHRAKDEGLKGKAKGAFISSIAQQEGAVAAKDEPGASCDFADDLEAALAGQDTQAEQETEAEQADGGPRGKSAEAPGKAKPGDDGSDEESTPEPEESPEEEVEIPLETDVSENAEG